MRNGGRPGGPVFWLLAFAACLVARLPAQQPDDPAAAALLAFRDDGQPTLLAALERDGPPAADVLAALHALGPAAHEALLGYVLRPFARRDPAVLAAFGDFDARAAWALPLLAHEANVIDPCAQELLRRLGPAAAAAVPALQELCRTKYPSLQSLVDDLVRASDQPLPAPYVPPRPRVPNEAVPGLLRALAVGPATVRWPALQALLAAGDDAAEAAAEVLWELEIAEATGEQGQALAAALRCVAGARCLPGWNALDAVAGPDQLREARRLALAGRLHRQALMQRWLRDPDDARRRIALLGLAMDDGVESHRALRWLPVSDADPALQRRIERLCELRAVRGARFAASLLPTLAATPISERGPLLDRLAAYDLQRAPASPASLWPLVVAVLVADDALSGKVGPPEGRLDSEEFASRSDLGRSAEALLRQQAQPGFGVPAGLLVLVPQLGTGATYAQVRRELLRAADPAALAACLRDCGSEPPLLARWLRCLLAADVDAAPVVALVGETFAAQLAAAPAPTQLDWYEWNRAAPVPESLWSQWLRPDDGDQRRRALGLAMRRRPAVALELPLLVECLQDRDVPTAALAGFLLGRDDRAPAEAVAALAARCATADPELHGRLLQVLLHQRAHAHLARPAIEAAFASSSWRVRLPAAVLLLALEPDHAPARAALDGWFVDRKAEVRRQALFQVANVPELAASCVDAAFAALDDRDEQVRCSAVRLLGAVPAAQDRSVPVLRSLWQQDPKGLVGQRAKAALDALERAATSGQKR